MKGPVPANRKRISVEADREAVRRTEWSSWTSWDGPGAPKWVGGQLHASRGLDATTSQAHPPKKSQAQMPTPGAFSV